MTVSSRWEIWVRWAAKRVSGGVVLGAGAPGRGFGDVEGFADVGVKDFTDYDSAE